MVAVLPRGRGRQPKHVPRTGCSRHLLERSGGQMVALVEDQVPMAGHQVVHPTLATQTLEQRHVDQASRSPPAADLANPLGIDTQEGGQPVERQVIPHPVNPVGADRYPPFGV